MSINVIIDSRTKSDILTTEDHDANIRDALGDILIYACDVANMEGINLSEILSTVWSSVSKRDWTKEPTP